jgi:hypothetical protein
MNLETTITVLADEWLTTKQAAEVLNRDIRTLQKLAAGGMLKWKRRPGTNARLYEAADIQRYLKGGATGKKTDETSSTTAVAVRSPKLSQGERALDTVTIVGQMLAAQKIEREHTAQNFEALITKVLDKLSDNSERVLAMLSEKVLAPLLTDRKEERRDSRERWELERQDKLARLEIRKGGKTKSEPDKEPEPAGKPNGKAKGARA